MRGRRGRGPRGSAHGGRPHGQAVAGWITVIGSRRALHTKVGRLTVTFEGALALQIGTPPRSLTRLRLARSAYQVALEWDGQVHGLSFTGVARGPSIVRPHGSSAPSGRSCYWPDADLAGEKLRRTAKCRAQLTLLH